MCVLNLQASGGAVTDSNPHLASCCQLLELLLRKGLQRQSHTTQIPIEFPLFYFNISIHICERSLMWSRRWSCTGACAYVCLCSAEPVLSLVHRDYWQCFEQLTHQDACGRYVFLLLWLFEWSILNYTDSNKIYLTGMSEPVKCTHTWQMPENLSF